MQVSSAIPLPTTNRTHPSPTTAATDHHTSPSHHRPNGPTAPWTCRRFRGSTFYAPGTITRVWAPNGSRYNVKYKTGETETKVDAAHIRREKVVEAKDEYGSIPSRSGGNRPPRPPPALSHAIKMVADGGDRSPRPPNRAAPNRSDMPPPPTRHLVSQASESEPLSPSHHELTSRYEGWFTVRKQDFYGNSSPDTRSRYVMVTPVGLMIWKQVSVLHPTCHLPLATYHLPPATYHLPPTTYHLPPTTYHLPPTTCHLPPTTTRRLQPSVNHSGHPSLHHLATPPPRRRLRFYTRTTILTRPSSTTTAAALV